MTEIVINDSDRRIQFTATGGQTVFPYDFPIFDEAHLVVTRLRAGTLTTFTLTTDYTVSGVGVEAGGNVTLVSGATAGDVITIYGDTPVERTTDFNDAGDFFAATLNREFDLQTQMIQQVERDLGRGLRLQPGDEDADMSLPLKAERASRFQAYDANGEPIASAGPTGDSSIPVSTFIETLLDDTAAAAARTTLGLTNDAAGRLTIGAAASGLATTSGLTQSTGRLLGRTTASAGAVEEITPGADMTFSAGALGVAAATTTLAGKSELATTAETQTGTDATRTVTPAGFRGAVGFSKYVESAEQAVSAGNVTVAHGLAGTPVMVWAVLRCTTAELGYSIGDELNIVPTNLAGVEHCATYGNATNIGIVVNTTSFQVARKDTLAVATATAASWRIVLRALG